MSGIRYCGLLLVNTAWLVTAQVAVADSGFTASMTAASAREQGSASLARAVDLQEDQGARLAQAIADVVDVQINATESGVAVVLVTAEGAIALPTTTTVGNALIIDIPSAVLTLPDDNEVQATNPAEGIAFLSVSNLPDNIVRVALTGISAPPVADIRTTVQGLGVST